MHVNSAEASPIQTGATPLARVGVYLPAKEYYCDFSGGALATWTHEVYRRLEKNWRITVFGTPPPQPYPSPAFAPVPSSALLEKCYGMVRYRDWKGTLRPVRAFLRQSHARAAAAGLAHSGCSLIHIHNDPEAVLPIRRRNPNAAIVLHLHNDHLIDGGDGAESASDAVAAADRVVFCSEYLMKGAFAGVKNLRRDRCSIIYNGAELPAATPPIPAGADFKVEGGPLILFVGRLVEQKGAHVLLAAMPEVLAKFPTATVRIVGGVRFGSHEVDPYLASLRKQAAPLGPRVQFTGPVPHTEIARHFLEADIFACPSVWNDPLPLVNIEAMAAGAPVIAFARGGIPEVVSGAGMLIQEVGPGPLAAGLIQLLQDHELRRELAKKGRERVIQHLTWDIIAGQWHEFLERNMGGKGSPAS
jgi:spore coat protein SA